MYTHNRCRCGQKTRFLDAGEHLFYTTQIPLLRHQSPKREGALCDDARTGNTKLSQPGCAIASGAKAGITGAIEERYCNSIEDFCPARFCSLKKTGAEVISAGAAIVFLKG